MSARVATGATKSASSDCILAAWTRHEGELRRFLAHRLGDDALAQDLLQDVFVKAMRQGNHFCAVRDPRAWLFQVARNALVDHARGSKVHDPLPDDLPQPESEALAPVDRLSECLERVLREMAPADADILRQCDLGDVAQKDFAVRRGLTLPATKSRLLRARARLREALTRGCQVRLDEAGNVCCYVPRNDRKDHGQGAA